MMDCTDRHFRTLLRPLTRETLLYTEMITTSAILHGRAESLLAVSPAEAPLVLQLGGDDPDALAACVERATQWNYAEINLNVGCPSPRVQKGGFGAALMLRPDHVARCVAAMRRVCDAPVTVKHRLGVDDCDSYEELVTFVRTVAQAGADGFVVHARKAYLNGLSPRANRRVPPLRPDWVYALKREFPALRIEFNGEVASLEQAREHLRHVDGVMMGRAVRDNPMVLADADRMLFGTRASAIGPSQAARTYLPHVYDSLGSGVPITPLLRPLQAIYRGRPGARHWRRELGAVATTATGDPRSTVRRLAAAIDRMDELDAANNDPAAVGALASG